MLATFVIIATTLIVPVIAYQITKFMNGFIKETTNNEAEEHGASFAKFMKQLLATSSSKKIQDLTPSELNEHMIIILGKMTKNILEMNNDKIKEIGMDTQETIGIITARNGFWQAYDDNKTIKGIGFTKEHDFPIPRDEFLERASMVLPKEEDEKTVVSVEIVTIKVTAPNWEQKDKQHKWKGIVMPHGPTHTFTISDDKFWRHVDQANLTTSTGDTIKVQWICEEANGGKPKYEVLRVLSFSSMKISSELSTEELERISNLKVVPKTTQPDLFNLPS